jgi:hypothetical protein
MLQTSPTDNLFRAFDPTPLPFDQSGDARSPFASGGGLALAAAPVPAGSRDGVATPWFQPATPVDPPLSGAGWGGTGSQGGAIMSLISSLLGAVQQLVSSLFGGSLPGTGQSPGGQGPCGRAPGAPQGPNAQQFFGDADLGSVGDPHLSLVGTRHGTDGDAHVDEHFDSMTSHRDLFDSRDVAGGYRVSTAVSQPDANGVTTNRSATVHAGFGQDAITLRADGSFTVLDDGNPIALGKGQSAKLSGGETVRADNDGSLVVSAGTANGGSISTTLRALGGRVDVTAHAHGIDVGGDLVNHAP